MNYFRYGPSLRTIAAQLTGSDLFEGEGYVSPSADDTSSSRYGAALTTEGLHTRLSLIAAAESSEAKPTVLHYRPGQLLWFELLIDATPVTNARVQYAVYLDEPDLNAGDDVWRGWIASPYSAYASWWDVIPTAEAQLGQVIDPRAMMIHVAHTVLVKPKRATSAGVNLSASQVQQLRFVGEEFLQGAMHGFSPPARESELRADDTRMLYGLAVRTGTPVFSSTDPRFVFSQMYSAFSEEITAEQLAAHSALAKESVWAWAIELAAKIQRTSVRMLLPQPAAYEAKTTARKALPKDLLSVSWMQDDNFFKIEEGATSHVAKLHCPPTISCSDAYIVWGGEVHRVAQNGSVPDLSIGKLTSKLLKQSRSPNPDALGPCVVWRGQRE